MTRASDAAVVLADAGSGAVLPLMSVAQLGLAVAIPVFTMWAAWRWFKRNGWND